MSTTETQQGFSTASLLKTKVDTTVVQSNASTSTDKSSSGGSTSPDRPRIRPVANDDGSFNYPQIVYITKPVTIEKSSSIDRAVKGAVNVVVAPVSLVGHLALFGTTSVYKGLRLWARTFGFIGDIFNKAFLNIFYVIAALAVLSMPGIIAYYGSQYIRPMYDAYHSQDWLTLSAYSLGIFFGGSLIIGLVIGVFRFFKRKPSSPKRTIKRFDVNAIKESLEQTNAHLNK